MAIDATNIVGNVNLGKVGGDLIQTFFVGTPQAEPGLPWKEPTEQTDVLSLLQWRSRLTPLIGREAEMAELLRWVRDGGGIAARFLVGEGGVGKTRLAAELADKLRADGWCAGFASVYSDNPYPLKKPGTLLIVDYPEESREAVGTLLRLIGAADEPDDAALRLLFLSRKSQEHWQEDIDDTDATGAFNTYELGLPSIDAQSYGFELFDAARRSVPGTNPDKLAHIDNGAFTQWLAQEPVNLRPLFIVAAAVHSAWDPDSDLVSLKGQGVIEALVRRERKRLRNESKACGLDEYGLERLTAFATVSGGLTLQDIERLAGAHPKLGLKEPDQVVERVRKSNRLEGGDFPAPGPDIVTALLVLRVLAQRADLAPEWLWAALGGDVDDGLKRLARQSYDADFELGLAKEEPGGFKVRDWLSEMVSGDTVRCEAVSNATYYEPLEIGLLPMSVAVLRTLADSADDGVERAGHLNNLSVRLAQTGEAAGAVEASREAAGLYWELAASNREHFVPNLASSLNNLSNHISDKGDDPDLALEASHEAAGLYRELASSNPARFNPDLASSLNNLSNRLSDLGDPDRAVEAGREAAALYRELASSSPARFKPDLAMSLNTLSICFAKTNDLVGAVEASREAAGQYRELASSNPARFNSGLAMSLNTLSAHLSEFGDPERGLEASREAAGLYRELASSNPARFSPDLASSLNNLSHHISERGDGDEALKTSREAAGLYRELASSNPARFSPDLAMSLNNLASHLYDNGDQADALLAAQEALSLIEPYAEQYPKSPWASWRQTIQWNIERL